MPSQRFHWCAAATEAVGQQIDWLYLRIPAKPGFFGSSSDSPPTFAVQLVQIAIERVTQWLQMLAPDCVNDRFAADF